MEKGLFIAVEGIEGSGKSTLANSLAEKLTSNGISTLLTKEPGGTELGIELRRILLDSKFALFPQTETLLFLADRAQHVRELLIPAINSGMSVICDRYSFSTLAYQGFARGEKIEVLNSLVQFAHGGLTPDVVLVVDLPVEVALRRARGRKQEDSSSGNRFEEEELTFHERVKNGFLELARIYSDKSVVLDGELDRDALLKLAIDEITSRLNR